jgi:hypothetical protein
MITIVTLAHSTLGSIIFRNVTIFSFFFFQTTKISEGKYWIFRNILFVELKIFKFASVTIIILTQTSKSYQKNLLMLSNLYFIYCTNKNSTTVKQREQQVILLVTYMKELLSSKGTTFPHSPFHISASPLLFASEFPIFPLIEFTPDCYSSV